MPAHLTTALFDGAAVAGVAADRLVAMGWIAASCADATGHAFETKRGIGMNTTIGVVATDAALDQAELRRLAVMAQGGYAYAIRPTPTPFDGDAVFALSTGAKPLPDRPDALVRLGTVAADVVARAVMRGVHAADDLGESRSYRTTWPKPR
jgi:L-aminopeptidase/D-esterase-like protein